MTFFTDFDARVAAMRDLLPGGVTVEGLGATAQSLRSETVLELTRVAADVQQSLDQLKLVLSAEISARSAREFGHQGLAQSQGFRSPVELIQKVSGVSRSVAQQQIRVGVALLDHGCDAGAGADGVLDDNGEAVAGEDGDGAGGDGQVDSAGAGSGPWFAPLVQAMRSGNLTLAQHDAIRRGLGEPPASTADAGAGVDGAAGFDTAGTAVERVPDPGTIAAWSLAAVQLTEYAAEVPVEELAKQARAVRDLLDPVGMEARFAARYERRSFTFWTDADGFTHGKFIFDDESAEWVRTLIDTALRPRRGGPRFVTVDERAKAAALVKDPRTIDQLTHDLLIDVLRAGSIADASTVLGARQAGIKLVQVVDRDEYLAEVQAKAEAEAGRAGATGTTGAAAEAAGAGAGPDARGGKLRRAASTTRLLESGTILPTGAGDAHKCRTGQQTVIVDRTGDPLNVGREQRLFTTSQRVALAVRDGGCRWTGCDRPASYCEAHHIDEWTVELGRTDIDRGVLLCRFHHMQLHNRGWRITREGRGPFLLHPPRSRDAVDRPPGWKDLEAVGDPPDQSPGREDLGVVGDPPERPPGRDDRSAVVEPLDRPPGNMQPVELRPPLPLSYAWQTAAPAKKKFPTAA